MLQRDFILMHIRNNFSLAGKIFANNRLKFGITGSNQNAYSMIVTCLKMLFKLSDRQIARRVIIDGNNDGAVDAIYVDDQNRVIHVLDVKGTDTFGRNEIINIFLGEFKRNFLNRNTNLTPLNFLARARIGEARIKYLENQYKVKVYFIRCLFLGDACSHNTSLKTRFIKEISQYQDISVEFIGAEDLISRLFYRDKKEFPYRIIFNNNDFFCDRQNNVAIGKIPIIDIVNMVNLAEQPDINYNIFDDNVRVDHENDSLKDDLKQTLLNNLERFFLFHNGITLSCSNISNRGDNYFDLVNPQILNGCQSIKALQRIYFESGCQDCFNGATILCRLFQSRDSNDVNSICQSTNSQRPITTWDLRANDTIQKILEGLFLDNCYFYNRKRSRNGSQNKVYITDLAQWICTCLEEKPAKAKSAKKYLFDISKGDRSDYVMNIFKSNHNITNLINLCSSCLFVKSIIDKSRKERPRDKDYRSFLKHADFHIMAYFWKFGQPNDEQSARGAIGRCLLIATNIMTTQGASASYNNIFKNEQTWIEISRS